MSRLAKSVAQLVAQNGILGLPLRGRMYRIQCPEFAKVAPIAAVLLVAENPPSNVTPDQLVLDGKSADAALEVLLGANYGRMLLDGVPPELIEHAGDTVLVWMVRGIDRAIVHWERWHPEKDALAFSKPVQEA